MGLPNIPSIFNADSGFHSVPKFGGSLGAIAGTVSYTDSTAKTLFTLPKNAVPAFFYIDVTTDFDAGTTNDLDIGITGTAGYFASGVDVGTQGIYDIAATGVANGALGVQLDVETIVTATYTESGVVATQGAANIIMFYYIQENGYTVT